MPASVTMALNLPTIVLFQAAFTPVFDAKQKTENSIIKVTSDIHDKTTGKETTETRWYISSLGVNAEQALYSARYD